RIRGVVEADFFDWVTDTPAGESFVRNLGRRIARFDWSAVEHDVLKVLYESVITKNVREKLGEYYTPDWLADRMVHTFIPDPLDTVAADPACGSGTFLFHAIRHYLDAAQAAGIDTDDAVQQATAHVIGLDVHPVAVTLARVTYLLALGRDNINSAGRKELTIPVYLGDSIQWKQETDMFTTEVVRVRTDDSDLFGGGGGLLFALDLCFPRSVLKDATQFDYLVSEMADKALTTDPKDATKAIATILKRRGIAADSADGEVLRETFLNLCTLRAQGRNHIWGYYVRNLIRPLWLAEPENSVDIVIGNPPWLRYNKMPPGMQKNYLDLAKPRNLLTGGLGASARDLSTLFVVRAVELYLRTGGAFAFVMPHGVLTRKPHTGFRSGNWSTRHGGHLTVKFAPPWDLDNVTTGFPMTSCVVNGKRAPDPARMPTTTLAWHGRLPRADLPWTEASAKITTSPSTVAALDHGAITVESPYKSRFRAGAILYPRSLMFVVDAPKGPLGAGAGRRAVTSLRSSLEKQPWKSCPSITANVEQAFIRPVYLGEQVLPFRTLTPREAVLPITDTAILTSEGIDLHAGLAAWWNDTESAWEQHRAKTETKPLSERIDYHGQLSAQLPISPTRVVYTASGNTLAAAIIRDNRAIIEHKLYWMPVLVEDEAHYLCAILNSAPLLAEVKPLQAIGLFGGRDFDKNVFAVPFPTFDPGNPDHCNLAALGRRAEEAAATVDLSSATKFQAARKLIRKHLVDTGIEADIVAAVTQLLLLSSQ
ncbi:MAG: N-6 DNA methylase, partial [Hyphomicrobiaceae bacterium]|nr:N-6 DNA methylase [Hyphomicrobiaceae bacterium]